MNPVFAQQFAQDIELLAFQAYRFFMLSVFDDPAILALAFC
jgi:hypothetical protein